MLAVSGRPLQTECTTTAGAEGHHNTVARSHLADPAADTLNNTCTLMAENGGQRIHQRREQVRMTNAAGDHSYHDFVSTWVVELERLDDRWPRRGPSHGSRNLHAYQLPVLAIDAHGSAGVSAEPACSSSTEIPSGERTKAIRPSRGGRLMTTPCCCRRSHAA